MRTLIVSVLSFLFSCGSQLPAHNPTYQHPASGTMVEISSGKESSLENFLIEKNAQYTMLVFGSEFCLACTQKNKKLRDELYDRHPAFQNPEFHLYGVNIDYDLEFVKEYVSATNFHFIELWDKEAQFLISNYYKDNANWGVPVTIFLKGNEILFKYDYSEHQDMKLLLDRAQDLMQ